MKKTFALVILLSIFLVSVSLVGAQSNCDLKTKLINQDPYPANPGEDVKATLQITGVDDPQCGKVSIRIKEEFPIILAPDQEKKISIQSGTYIRKHPSFWLVPLNLRVSKDSSGGTKEVEMEISKKGNEGSSVIESFDVEVNNTQTKFEMFVREYNKKDKEITFDLINVGDNDIESLVVEIPQQKSIKLAGSNKKTVGFLDSNEDTTVRFKVSEINGENIEAKIRYNDAINERREISKNISLNPEILESSEEEQNTPISTYLLIALVILIIAYWVYKKVKNKKSQR